MNNLYIDLCPSEKELYEKIYGEEFFKLPNCSIKSEDILKTIKDLSTMNGYTVIDSINLFKEEERK